MEIHLPVSGNLSGQNKASIEFHLKIQTVEPGSSESALSGRSSGLLANPVASCKVAVTQSNPLIGMLKATRDYVPLLDSSYKQLLGPAYTVYLRFLSGQRYGRFASKKVAQV